MKKDEPAPYSGVLVPPDDYKIYQAYVGAPDFLEKKVLDMKDLCPPEVNPILNEGTLVGILSGIVIGVVVGTSLVKH